MQHILASAAKVFIVTFCSVPFLAASGLTLLPPPTAATTSDPCRMSL